VCQRPMATSENRRGHHRKQLAETHCEVAVIRRLWGISLGDYYQIVDVIAVCFLQLQAPTTPPGEPLMKQTHFGYSSRGMFIVISESSVATTSRGHFTQPT
jgi:hypothetical protein